MREDIYVGGVFKIPSFYHRNKMLKDIIITDELLDKLGDEFQHTKCKVLRGWTFEEWSHERIGLKIALGPDAKPNIKESQ